MGVIKIVINKYDGINDMPNGWAKDHSRIYRLWFDMLRRCYDDAQLSRDKGKAYKDCEVCDDWKHLSKFYEDIKTLAGYEQWLTTTGMVLDKDILRGETKEYNKHNCCFVPASVNLAVMNKQNPNITKNANEAKRIKYSLEKDGVRKNFDSEIDACNYLGVRKCSVAGAWRRGCKCKGYTIIRNPNSASMENDNDECRKI